MLTKASLWLPQSVANVLFASLTDSERHHRVFGRAVAGLAGLGLALVTGSWLLGGLVTEVVGGGRYPQLRADVWLFAMLGSCLAVLQFTLVAGPRGAQRDGHRPDLGRRGRRGGAGAEPGRRIPRRGW